MPALRRLTPGRFKHVECMDAYEPPLLMLYAHVANSWIRVAGYCWRCGFLVPSSRFKDGIVPRRLLEKYLGRFEKREYRSPTKSFQLRFELDKRERDDQDENDRIAESGKRDMRLRVNRYRTRYGVAAKVDLRDPIHPDHDLHKKFENKMKVVVHKRFEKVPEL